MDGQRDGGLNGWRGKEVDGGRWVHRWADGCIDGGVGWMEG